VTPLYPQKLALTWPTGGGRSVGIVCSRTKATEFSLVLALTYFAMRALSAQNQSQLCTYCNLITTISALASHSILPPAWCMWSPLTQYLPNPASVGFRNTCPIVKHMSSSLCYSRKCKASSVTVPPLIVG
jgi:hypothetical protein